MIARPTHAAQEQAARRSLQRHHEWQDRRQLPTE
jgi:hypothetical protein